MRFRDRLTDFVGGSTLRSFCKLARLLASGLVLTVISNASASAGCIMGNTDELLASPTAQVSQSNSSPDRLPEETDPPVNLGKGAGLPASGAGTSAPGNGGAPSVMHVACEHPLSSDAALVVWLAKSRFFFRQTLLPSDPFRPPRGSS